MQDPLRMPKPQNWGYVDNIPIRQTQLQQPQVREPQLDYPPAEMQMPDVVKARYGLGDKNVVYDLLRIVNGEEGQNLKNIPSTYAAKLLTDAGLPTTEKGWTNEQWKEHFANSAAMMNPMAPLLGGY